MQELRREERMEVDVPEGSSLADLQAVQQTLRPKSSSSSHVNTSPVEGGSRHCSNGSATRRRGLRRGVAFACRRRPRGKPLDFPIKRQQQPGKEQHENEQPERQPLQPMFWGEGGTTTAACGAVVDGAWERTQPPSAGDTACPPPFLLHAADPLQSEEAYSSSPLAPCSSIAAAPAASPVQEQRSSRAVPRSCVPAPAAAGPPEAAAPGAREEAATGAERSGEEVGGAKGGGLGADVWARARREGPPLSRKSPAYGKMEKQQTLGGSACGAAALARGGRGQPRQGAAAGGAKERERMLTAGRSEKRLLLPMKSSSKTFSKEEAQLDAAADGVLSLPLHLSRLLFPFAAPAATRAAATVSPVRCATPSAAGAQQQEEQPQCSPSESAGRENCRRQRLSRPRYCFAVEIHRYRRQRRSRAAAAAAAVVAAVAAADEAQAAAAGGTQTAAVEAGQAGAAGQGSKKETGRKKWTALLTAARESISSSESDSSSSSFSDSSAADSQDSFSWDSSSTDEEEENGEESHSSSEEEGTRKKDKKAGLGRQWPAACETQNAAGFSQQVSVSCMRQGGREDDAEGETVPTSPPRPPRCSSSSGCNGSDTNSGSTKSSSSSSGEGGSGRGCSGSPAVSTKEEGRGESSSVNADGVTAAARPAGPEGNTHSGTETREGRLAYKGHYSSSAVKKEEEEEGGGGTRRRNSNSSKEKDATPPSEKKKTERKNYRETGEKEERVRKIRRLPYVIIEFNEQSPLIGKQPPRTSRGTGAGHSSSSRGKQ